MPLAESQVLQFCKDWNNGESAKALGEKYGMSQASATNYVQRLRKLGVNLRSRPRGVFANVDVEAINRAIGAV